ncbi:methyltransferase domain-containing protein [Amycolatopsis granulosa]|uniref:methyltransferase domain-containing protein n=1 Tax=Amycolatopsis granulosa TaxID=185684 RepID=UPI001421FC76|nr:methyltransferase domain-containing protein [Amycolatopsis granulosa]NIH85267.1 SAM-dependent methyltransferase [Amycolatopsis granulosa]
MGAHTHDDIDWTERIPALRHADDLHAPVYAEVAARLVEQLDDQPVVVDAGSGAGGMSAAFAAELARRGGGTLVLVDAVPALLDVAETVAEAAVERLRVNPDLSTPSNNSPGTSQDGRAGTVPDVPARERTGTEHARAGLDGAVVAATVGRAHPGVDAVSAAALTGQVRIQRVHADVASTGLGRLVPAADLVWAAAMVHHLPDQQAGVSGLATALKPGGMLALVEGSPPTYCLPWDLGIGEPGLERRLLAARDRWFGQMRAGMPGAVGMPYGWNIALAKAGLERVGSFSHLIDRPAPPDETVRNYVLEHIEWLGSAGDDLVTQEDRDVLRRLLDPAGPHYLGKRDDLYVLGTQTVHFGFRP